jgi:hypothetical protein
MKFFICVPFSSRVDDLGHVFPDYRRQIEQLTSHIRGLGHDYFVALEYAGWRMGGDHDPDEELRHDFSQIDTSDCVIALLEERVSAGVQLENGYAYARGKKVYVFQIGKPAWSNLAFSRIAGHDIEVVDNEHEFVMKAMHLVGKLSRSSEAS